MSRPPESNQRPANALFGAVVVIGPYQANHFSVERGLEQIGKKCAPQKTGYSGEENCRSAPRAFTRKSI